MSFVDFAALKASLRIEQVAQTLGLVLKQSNQQLRGVCPACKAGGDRALVITPSKGVFYCFSAGKGGDLIALAAHIRAESVKDAAQFLAGGNCTSTSTVRTSSRQTVPESESGKQGERTLAPLSYLDADHPAVEAVGFDPEIAKQLGVGYAGKGLMRGTVAIPVRDERGVLQGYVGVTEVKLPPSFMGKNVVEFGKKSA